MQQESLGGAKYFVCFKDDFSKYLQVFFLKNKSEVVAVLKTFSNLATAAGHRIEEFVSDGGKEFDNTEIRDILQSKGITFRKTMPYSRNKMVELNVKTGNKQLPLTLQKIPMMQV
jgi:hypothetical protein